MCSIGGIFLKTADKIEGEIYVQLLFGHLLG